MFARSTDAPKNRPTRRSILVVGLVASLLLAAVPAVGDGHDTGLGDLDDDGETVTEEICYDDPLPGDAVPDIPGRELTEAWDYGDAPDASEGAATYPTRYTSAGASSGEFPTLSYTSNGAGQPGARHHVVSVGWLGNVQTGEASSADVPTLEGDADAQPDQDGTTTNLDPGAVTPDHDGKDDGLHSSTLQPGAREDIRFRVSTTSGITNWYVNVLVDWDYDGDWRDSQGEPEWAVQNHAVSVAAGQSQDFAATIDTGTEPGTPWVRVTLTPDRIRPIESNDWIGQVPVGTTDLQGETAFSCGETEDHCGPLEVEAEDWMDQDPIKCPRDTSGGDDEENDCTNHEVQSYTVDISTGVDQSTGAFVPYGQADDDWNITTAPRQANKGSAYAIPAIGPWVNPTTGRWVNPDFNDDAENDPAPETPGLYTYEAGFPGDDAAALVLFEVQWSRDDWSTANPDPDNYQGPFPTLRGFQYDETNPLLGSPGWQTIAQGWGHSHKDTFRYADHTPQDRYDLRVDVFNAYTHTGLLVEGEITVYCDAPLPGDILDPQDPLSPEVPQTPFEGVFGP